jgi:serine protease Do
VAEVTEGGPAAAAGIQQGDLVLQVNGQPISSASDLTRAVGLARAGDPIRLQVRRDGQVRDINVRSGLRPSEDSLAANDRTAPRGDNGDGAALGALGMQVAPDTQGKGVRVAGIDASSDAAQKGLRRGDLILRAGDKAINSPAELKAAVAEAKKAGRKSVLLFIGRGAQHTFVPVDIGQG